jgi:hypothetical protein
MENILLKFHLNSEEKKNFFLFNRWFTHFQDLLLCSLLFDCPVLDESCEDCVSGEYRCKDQEGTLLQIYLSEFSSKLVFLIN